MKRQIRRLTTAPNIVLEVLFFALGSSWLLVPYFSHSRLGSHAVTTYGGYWSWVLLLAEILSMLSITILVAKHHLWQQDKPMALLLLSFAGLMILNAALPAACQPNFSRMCLAPHSFGTNLHAILSGLSAAIIGLATLLDIRRRKKLFSFLFVTIQIIFLISEVSFAGDTSLLLIAQYVYETTMLLWMLYVLEGYKKSGEKFTYLISKPYRAVLAVWIGLSGIFEIIIAFGHHHIPYGTNAALVFHTQVWWIAQQTAFIGVLMIYLARQVYVGQRRAAYILLIIFGFELYKY
ncbi:MAG: hypothetical protein ACREGF_03395, partial [Candidatus Saccharimonadales bacterium]